MQQALTTTTRIPPSRFVPWAVPAWLPRLAEAPLIFVVSVLGGVLLAFSFATVLDVVTAIAGMPAASSKPRVSRRAAVVESGTRLLIITRPATFAERAAVEPVVAPVAPVAQAAEA